MKQSSRRKKGKLLQNFVREKILKTFPHLRKKDVVVANTGEPGPDIRLSRIAQRLVPWSFETKNQEKLSTVYQWFRQADRNSHKLEPALVIKKNGKKPLVVIELDIFFDLIK
tara:strand:+ start:1255 stop:1590 length:336 start_codon:yes stop_codon:yes gene_type:complete